MKLPVPTPTSWADVVLNFRALVKLFSGAAPEAIATRGTDAVTWGGVTRQSGLTTITHSLGRVPKSVTFGSSSSNVQLAYSTLTATTFDVQGNTIDGSVPIAGTARGFSWMAS